MTDNTYLTNKYQYRVGTSIYGSYDQALSAWIQEMNGTSSCSGIEVISMRSY